MRKERQLRLDKDVPGRTKRQERMVQTPFKKLVFENDIIPTRTNTARDSSFLMDKSVR